VRHASPARSRGRARGPPPAYVTVAPPRQAMAPEGEFHTIPFTPKPCTLLILDVKTLEFPAPPQGAVLVTLALCLLNNNTATRVHRHVQKLLDAFAGSSRGCDAPLRRGSNVAVLLYGQARTLNVTHCSIARNVLAPLLAEKHKVRIFVQGEADEDSWWGLPHTDTTGAVPFCPVPCALCPVPCALCPHIIRHQSGGCSRMFTRCS